ncbi:MAG: lipase family alpha/beta hydrolase [Pyrinomonadaceae bacterium]
MTAQRTYPIALAHGIARFDFLRKSIEINFRKLFGDVFDQVLSHLVSHGIQIQTDQLHYFRGIRTYLEDDGFDVHHTNVSFAKGLESRANDLKRQIEDIINSTRTDKVHIIAHSMGGLDSRFMIAKLGMADRVASLTTIGTPHFGSSFADAGVKEGGTELIALVSRAIDIRGFEDLTSDSCKRFNDSTGKAEAKNSVFYQTYSSAEDRARVFTFLQPSWDVINIEEGDNDGLVSVRSQAWVAELVADDGTSKKVVQKRFPIQADHLNEVGWWDLDEIWGDGPFNKLDSRTNYELAIKQVYLDIARDLRARFPA